MNASPGPIKRIALLNFGGIGDEILFTPVIDEIRRFYPEAHLALILEDRSRSVADLLPGVDDIVAVNVQRSGKPMLFGKLVKLLRHGHYDAVVSSGSSPFIPLLLAASGIGIRVGYQTGLASHLFLSAEAPLDRRAYAGVMYRALAEAFLRHTLGSRYQPTGAMPVLAEPDAETRRWAEELLARHNPEHRKIILIHPGVSAVSIEKNILKGWSAHRWAQLVEILGEDHRVVLIGGPDDAPMVESLMSLLPDSLPHCTNLYGETRNLAQLAALVLASDLLISVDSSPLHIAVGYQKPVVAMFGPTDEKKLVPADPRYQPVVMPDLACRPCLWDARKESCDRPVCLDVPVGVMADAVNSSLARQS